MFRSSLIPGLLSIAVVAIAANAPTAAAANNQYSVTIDKTFKTAKYDGKAYSKKGYRGGGYHNGHHGVLTRRVVRRILRHRGYHSFDFIERRGDRYVSKAYDWRNRHVRLAINAYSGEIIRKKILYAASRGHNNGYLSVHQLKHHLSGQGFYRVHRIRMKRGHYYAHSYDKYGSPILLTVNARNGRVLACDPVS